MAAPPPALRGAFDHVLLNPPFFDRRRSTRSPDPGRDVAHGGAREDDDPLAPWLRLAARRLRPGGTLTAIARAALLPALLRLPPGLGSPDLLPLSPRAGEPPLTVLLRARKGGRAPLLLRHPLALHAPGGAPLPWVEAVLRDAAPLPWEAPPPPSPSQGRTVASAGPKPLTSR